jgi:uncharacterized protein (TIGR02266 family)
MIRASTGPTTQPASSRERTEVHDFGRFRDRDELLVELLWAANADLGDVQLFLVRDDVLRGYLAVQDGEIDELRVRELRLPLSLLSVACRTVEDGIPYIGPLPPTDPCAALVNPEQLDERGMALIPMRVNDKPLGLLLGHPRGSVDRALRDTLVVLADEAVYALGRLISDHRAARKRAETARKSPDKQPVVVGNGERQNKQTLNGVAPSRAPLRVGATSSANPVLLDAPKARGRADASASDTGNGRRNDTGDAFPASDPRNRRAFRRESLRVEVHYRTEWGYFTGFMEDISQGGLFVTTYTRPPIGDHTELCFSIPDEHGEPVECKALAEVRWLRDPNIQTQQLPGMGLSFVKMPARSYRAICSFVRD